MCHIGKGASIQYVFGYYTYTSGDSTARLPDNFLHNSTAAFRAAFVKGDVRKMDKTHTQKKKRKIGKRRSEFIVSFCKGTKDIELKYAPDGINVFDERKDGWIILTMALMTCSVQCMVVKKR